MVYNGGKNYKQIMSGNEHSHFQINLDGWFNGPSNCSSNTRQIYVLHFGMNNFLLGKKQWVF